MTTMPISMNIIRQMWLINFALFDQLEDFVTSQLVKTDLPPRKSRMCIQLLFHGQP